MTWNVSKSLSHDTDFTAVANNGNLNYGTVVATANAGRKFVPPATGAFNTYLVFNDNTGTSRNADAATFTDGDTVATWTIPQSGGSTKRPANSTATVWIIARTVAATAAEITFNVNNTNCVVSGLPSNVYIDTVLNITATATTNKKFFAAPTITGTDTNGNPIAINAVLSNNDTVATFANVDLSQYSLDANTVLTLTATAQDTALNFVGTLVNCTLSTTPENVYKTTSNAVIRVDATGDNLFTDVPYLTFTDANNVSHTINFVIAYSQKFATANVDFTQYSLTDAQTINVYATASGEIVRTLTVTQNLVNCTISGLPSPLQTNSQLNVVLTAAQNCVFNAAPEIVFNEYVLDNNGNLVNTIPFTLSNSNTVATLNADLSQFDLEYDDNICTAVTINGTASGTPPPSLNLDVETSLQNATISGLPQTVTENTVLQLTATANTGYQFNTPPQINGYDANGNIFAENFTVANDKLTATITFNCGLIEFDSTNHTINIVASADAITPYIEKYGTINVYKVTTNDLAAFAAQRFFKEKLNPSDTSGYFQLIDLGDFVVSVKRFYCAVNDTLSAVLKCGNYNTNINVQTPQNDNLTVDCGTVAIPMHNNSNVDYDSEIKCFIPFVGYVNIPSEYCGKTIALQYAVNLITGDCLAKLTCNGIVIDFVECTISNEIVYKTNKENNFVGNAEFNLQVLKGLQPFISVKYYSDENKHLYNADCVRVSLNSVIGFAQITELTNFASANITENEKSLLNSLLSNGVIFENVP